MQGPMTTTELRKLLADTIRDAEAMLEIIGDDESLPDHARIIHWLLPDVKRTLGEFRAGKKYAWESPQLLPMHTLLILIDHINMIMEETVGAMSDEEYAQVIEEMKKL